MRHYGVEHHTHTLTLNELVSEHEQLSFVRGLAINFSCVFRITTVCQPPVVIEMYPTFRQLSSLTTHSLSFSSASPGEEGEGSVSI